MIRSYSGLIKFHTLETRYDYLALRDSVGESTFGFDRYVNQQFYTSKQWRDIRHHIIARDRGCDLGIEGYEIHNRPIIHHMNPMTLRDIVHGDEAILDPEFLITTSHRTHNAIHFGDKRLLFTPIVARKVGDTRLW